MDSACDICGDDGPVGKVRVQGTKFRRVVLACRPCRCNLSDAIDHFVDNGGQPQTRTEVRTVHRDVPVDRIIMRREIGPGVSRWWVLMGFGFGLIAASAYFQVFFHAVPQ